MIEERAGWRPLGNAMLSGLEGGGGSLGWEGGWARGAEEALWRGRFRLPVEREVQNGGVSENIVYSGIRGKEARLLKWCWISASRGLRKRAEKSEKMGRILRR